MEIINNQLDRQEIIVIALIHTVTTITHTVTTITHTATTIKIVTQTTINPIIILMTTQSIHTKTIKITTQIQQIHQINNTKIHIQTIKY